MKVTFSSSEISALFLYYFFLSVISQVLMLILWILLWTTPLFFALKSFSCWLVPSALFSLLSFPFFFVPARFGLSRPVPNPMPRSFQGIWVQQCWMFWQFTPGVVGEITRDNLWLAGKTHLIIGLFHLLPLTHCSPSCSCSPGQSEQQVPKASFSPIFLVPWHFGAGFDCSVSQMGTHNSLPDSSHHVVLLCYKTMAGSAIKFISGIAEPPICCAWPSV